MAPPAKPMALPSQVDALRALAKKVEATGKGLSPKPAEAGIPFVDVRRRLGV